MSTLNYQLPSKFENYQEFDTVKDAVEWMIKSQETFKRHGNEGFVYVSLTDGKLMAMMPLSRLTISTVTYGMVMLIASISIPIVVSVVDAIVIPVLRGSVTE